MINLTESEQRLELPIEGAKVTGHGKLWRIAPASLDATIVVGEKPGVAMEERDVDAVPEAPTFAPFSVMLDEFFGVR